jgi:hypothetical protein
MKTTGNVLFALLLLGVTTGAASAQPSAGAEVQAGPGDHGSVDIGYFYDSLAPYGNWINRPSHGWVWTPRDVSASWRPYQAGHWVWSDQGWTWLSDEPYGWATYHYGRWYQDPEIGWAWTPGTEWAPAWVSFQQGKDYVGWAPLPPGANVNASYNGGNPGGGPGNAGGPGSTGSYNGPPPSNVDQGGYGNGQAYGNGPGYDNGQAYGNDPAYDNNGPANQPVYDNSAGYDQGPGYQPAPVYGGGYGYDAGYTYGGGYGGGYANYAYGIAPEAYLFVPVRSFLSINLFDLFVPWVRVSSFFGFTHNCTDYGFYGGRYFNRGIPFAYVSHFYGNVPRYRLGELGGFRGHGFEVAGNRLAFFRPQVNRGWRGSPLDRAGARRSVVTASQFRNDHPDRQRGFAQTTRPGFDRNNNQGRQRGDRTAQQWQGRDQVNRQRSFENGRGQAEGRQQMNGAGQRGQQDQAYRQRSNDTGRVQAQRQQQYNTQRYQQQSRSYQRQAPPQRQPSRGNESHGSSHGQASHGQNHGGGHGGDHKKHGG